MPFEITVKRYLASESAEEIKTFKFNSSVISIGSDANRAIYLEEKEIEVNHASIELDDSGCFIVPSGKTYLNKDQVTNKSRLKNNDLIEIGKYKITVLMPGDPDKSSSIIINVEEDVDVSKINKESEDKYEKVEYFSRYNLVKSIFNVRVFTLLFLLLFIAGFYFMTKGENEKALSPGPLSDAHSLFENDCKKCHVDSWNSFSELSDDNLRANHPCLSCHNVNVHNDNERFTPNCVSCHKEHNDNINLSQTYNKFCIKCHSDLTVKGGSKSVNYHNKIIDFESTHPEFAVTRAGEKYKDIRIRLDNKKELIDTTPIKLNHKVHLADDLRGPGEIEKLSCDSCHQISEKGDYTVEITYEKDCERCHSLDVYFDYGNLKIPHGDPKIIREFLRQKISTEAIGGFKGTTSELRKFVDTKLKESEKILYSTVKCSECHISEYGQGKLPVIEKPNIPSRWLSHGKFNHALHTNTLRLSCTSCHEVSGSEKTTDILLPSIDTCKQCHSESKGATSDCVLCHDYHKNSELKFLEDNKTIKQIVDK